MDTASGCNYDCFIRILIVIILNPAILYASKTIYGNYAVYHNSTLDNYIKIRIEETTELIKTSELYDENLKFDVCLNNRSFYPKLIENLRGQAFGWDYTTKLFYRGVQVSTKIMLNVTITDII